MKSDCHCAKISWECLPWSKSTHSLFGTFPSIIFPLFWMGLLSCLTHPSPVIRSQAPTGKVTKGCNLPSAECDSGTGRVRNTCEKPPSRSAGVSERWRNVSLGECEGQHPCQDRGGEKRRLERDLPSRHSFWTPLLVRCCNREFWRFELTLDLIYATKKTLVGPAVEQNWLFSRRLQIEFQQEALQNDEALHCVRW